MVGGDALPNNGRKILVYQKVSGSPVTVTAAAPGKIEGLSLVPPALSISSGAAGTMGPFDPTIFNSAAGRVDLSYSGDTTGTTVAAITF